MQGNPELSIIGVPTHLRKFDSLTKTITKLFRENITYSATEWSPRPTETKKEMLRA